MLGGAWCSADIFKDYHDLMVMMLPDPIRGMVARKSTAETHSRATPQGLDQKSKMEVMPKMARRRGSDARQSRRRRVRSCRGVCRRCKNNSPSVLSCIGKRTKESCDRGSEVKIVHSGRDGKEPVPLWKPRCHDVFGWCLIHSISNNNNK